VGFSRVMKERGVVRNFREARTKKGRFWEGIDVIEEGGVVNPPLGEQSEKTGENEPKVDTHDKVVTRESPAKHGGVVDPVTTSTDFAKGFVEYPRDTVPLENDDKVVILSPEDDEGGETYEFTGESEQICTDLT
jgi:hypothetical protein